MRAVPFCFVETAPAFPCCFGNSVFSCGTSQIRSVDEVKPSRNPFPRLAVDSPVHVGIFIAVAGACVFQVCSFDIFWHLEIGRLLWHGGGIIGRNLFSWTYPDHPWTPTYWLFEAIVYPVYRVAGATGLILVRTLVLAVGWGGLARHFERRGIEPWLLLVVFLAAIDVSLFRFLLRPHIFSFLGLALLIERLDLWRDAPDRRVFLWQFPLLFTAWANLHSGIVFGFAYFALILAELGGDVFFESRGRLRQRVGRVLRSQVLRRGVMLFGLCLAGCLINPTGWGFFRYVFDHLTMDLVIPIEELAPFHAWQYPKTAFVLGWLILLPPLTAAAAGRVLTGVWLRALFSLFLMSKGIRFVPIVCLFSLPGVFETAAIVRDRWSSRPAGGASKGATRRLPPWPRHTAVHVLAPLLFILHAHVQVYRLPESLFVTGIGFNHAAFPFRVGTRLPREMKRGLYNSFSVGGWVTWATHGRTRVFQDGRIHAYPAAFFRHIEPLLSTTDGVKELFQEFAITQLLVRKAEDPVAATVAVEDPNWRVLAEDENFLYAVRTERDPHLRTP